MSIRLIRQESETPNVSNHDDARMVRYAYGGYDGFVRAGDRICDQWGVIRRAERSDQPAGVGGRG